MPWCPKCKNEYKEGYTVCADCGSTLVDCLEDVKVAICEGTQDKLQDICNFFNANGIDDTEIVFVSEQNTYSLHIPEKRIKEAEEQIRVYLMNMEKESPLPEEEYEQEATENTSSLDNTDEMEDTKNIPLSPIREVYKGAYREVGKKAEEYKAGADILLMVGILGIIALVLLHLGVLPISFTGFNKVMITLVMGALFIIFVVMGISSHKSYRELKEAEGGEQDLKTEVGNFLKENMDVNTFDKGLEYDNPTMEILYFRRIERMKGLILSKYPNLETSFMDFIIEETYAEIFE